MEAVERAGAGGVGTAICAAETVECDGAARVWLLVDNPEVLVLRNLLFAHFDVRTWRVARDMNDDGCVGWFAYRVDGCWYRSPELCFTALSITRIVVLR